jgi:hypothetical protein
MKLYKLFILSLSFLTISNISFAQESNSELHDLQAKIQRLESTIQRVKERYLLADSMMVLPISENEIQLQKLKLEEYNLINRSVKGTQQATNLEGIPFLYIKKSELDTYPENKRNYILSNPNLYRIIENQ